MTKEGVSGYFTNSAPSRSAANESSIEKYDGLPILFGTRIAT
jgi:hypothetical protein